MAPVCCMPSMKPQRPVSCAKCLLCKSCARCGCRTIPGSTAKSAGALPRRSLRLAQYIGSPYDIEAHYSKKRSTTWVGYKVHLTKTCEKESPHLITHVETTSAPVSD